MKKEDLTPGTPVIHIHPTTGAPGIFTVGTYQTETHVNVIESDTPLKMSELQAVTPASVMRLKGAGYQITEAQMNVFRAYWNNKKLTVFELANAIYEGTPALQNLAEKLARQHGKAQALTFFSMMGSDVQNFYLHIAQQLIDHAAQWQKNEGSGCVLSDQEADRLKTLPRHPELMNKPKMPWEK